MFICISIPEHNTCSGDVSGKASVVLLFCYYGAIWEISSESFDFESFLYKKLLYRIYSRISRKILDKFSP